MLRLHHSQLWLLVLVAALCLACNGAASELERRGISIEPDQLVAQAAAGRGEVVQLLVRAGVAVDARDLHGNTALLAACEAGQAAVARYLLEQGADPSLATPRTGATPLALAVARGHREIVGLLLEAGAQLETPEGSQGMTPLAVAAFKGHTEILSDLLAAGADVAAADRWGWTPLHHAVGQGQIEPARRLLAAGAEPDVRDDKGWSPRQLAEESGPPALRATFAAQPPSVAALVVVPPGWELFDPFAGSSPYWPDLASLPALRDPPGGARLLLRSPVEEQAQLFLVVGREADWRPRFAEQIEELASHPLLEAHSSYDLTSRDGLGLQVYRFRIGPGVLAGRRVERLLALGRGEDGRSLIVDAGGDPDAAGVSRIDAVLRASRLATLLRRELPATR